MKYHVEFFRYNEFRCSCCGQGKISALLAYELDELRRAWAAPIRVNSGWRCASHNREVGGVEQSRHLIGCAADIAPIDPALFGPFQTLVAAMFGRRESWELKIYSRFVHVAVPREEQKYLWDGTQIIVTAR